MVLLLVGISIVVLATIAHSILRSQAAENGLRRTTVAFQTISNYYEKGLLAFDKQSVAEFRFFVPNHVLSYHDELTFGQVLDDVRQNFDRASPDLGVSLPLEDFVRLVASRLVAGTALEDRVRVNEPPLLGYLNIVFVAEDPANVSDTLAKNVCAYTRLDALIICNREIFLTVLRDFERINTNEAVVIAVFGSTVEDGFQVNFLANIDELRQLLRQSFIVWIIGHEIGHVLNDGPASPWEQASPLHFDLVYNAREQRADAFAIEVITRDTSLSASFVALMLEYVEHSFRDAFTAQFGQPPVIQPWEDQPQDKIKVGSTRDTLLLWRAAKMLEQANERDPAALSRLYYMPVQDRFAFVHSLKSSEYVNFLATRMNPVVRGSKIRTILLVFGSALAAAFVGLYLTRRSASSNLERLL